jgi:Ca2+-binding RTX toxin-like protein
MPLASYSITIEEANDIATQIKDTQQQLVDLDAKFAGLKANIDKLASCLNDPASTQPQSLFLAGGFVTSTNGNETIFNDAGMRLIRGTAASDDITLLSPFFGGIPTEIVTGGAGKDLIRYSPPSLLQGASLKVFSGGDGRDTLILGADRSKLAILVAAEGVIAITPFTRVTVYIDTGSGSGGVPTEVPADGPQMLLNGIERVNFSNGSIIDIRGAANDAVVGAAGADIIQGGAGADTLSGNGGDDDLDGGTGNDTLRGGLGNDIFHVDVQGEAQEEVAAGTDCVFSSISYSLGANLENLVLVGAGNLSAIGNTLDNRITGNDGGNLIRGGAGLDQLLGGKGNDIYEVDRPGEAVENSSSGVDLVRSNVSYELGFAIEKLHLLGTGNIAAIGNAGANTLTGNAGANLLDGRGGTDRIAGGSGSDTYVVDNPLDTIDESAVGSTGADTVQSSVSFSLFNSARVFGLFENLTLTGGANINATGNALANRIIGNSGHNILNGGPGADTMRGGAGNDVYRVDNPGDIVDESNGSGGDTVQSTVSVKLSDTAHIKGTLESVSLTGTASALAWGNGAANILTGNIGSNSIAGLGGNDVLNGGAGKDTLVGGAGQDFFVFNAALSSENSDTVGDFNAADDTFRLENTVMVGLGSATGALNPSLFFAGAAAHDSNDRIVYNKTTGALFYDANGNAAGGVTLLATLVNKPNLTAVDFAVI